MMKAIIGIRSLVARTARWMEDTLEEHPWGCMAELAAEAGSG
jgi:hypothetical protein